MSNIVVFEDGNASVYIAGSKYVPSYLEGNGSRRVVCSSFFKLEEAIQHLCNLVIRDLEHEGVKYYPEPKMFTSGHIAHPEFKRRCAFIRREYKDANFISCGEETGYFHQFLPSNECAIVELDDGHVELVTLEGFRFLDR